MSLPQSPVDPVARLEAELAQEKAAHARTNKKLEAITHLHANQAITISSQIGIIRSQIQRHPEDIADIQVEARKAEDERQRRTSEASAMGNGP
ncbi:uncharacterized protein J4E92_000061 [Alternaria infectoria]|uniref:uncharacterized protein n=1 Tax=Alternaria viburni TaxID=566460 RepID=UPI0020C3E059|nr:uncharacterized protein J4E79_008852 [Alternaria viburni]XP_051356992.1 uncharacterized protein J4E92_000061 [Alternaria infectoria]KAI4652546.1 hypothetical protein J4E79_008852 [Alternaria viburni]KAI4938780.1 hypothetical protein J4E92_000061 [Alternaria infectoria]